MPLSKQDIEFWNRVKELAKQTMKPSSYEFFIEPARLVEVKGNDVTILVNSSLHKDFWRKQADLITTAGFEIYEEALSYELYSDDEISHEQIEDSQNNIDSDYVSINGLNQKYTFDNFVLGPENKMTVGASLAVASMPGKHSNPLFIHGGAGLGKTHLMHAIGNEILKSNPTAKIKYVSSETFVNDYVNAARIGKMKNFEETYRNLDVLLLDDIQFFSDKEGTKTEFFNTFNILHGRDAQIVLTSDRPPQELNNLEERLVSRFAWGLTTIITPPDYETRMAILMNKSETSDVQFPQETLNYIAGQINSNVRELEGALKIVTFYAQTNDINRVDIETASEALKALQSNTSIAASTISVKKIQEQVSQHFHVSTSDILGTKRTKEIAFARQVAMYLIRELLHLSFPAIGEEFGGKDHTTVMYAHSQIKKKMREEIDVQKDIDSIKRQLQ
ncbi:MAG: chromosomal replication initiator protein DnaA [Streptococcaceae bacterium]|nr:chromosomal replication initiator protein DnaA [Streptococcaceae bacterium]